MSGAFLEYQISFSQILFLKDHKFYCKYPMRNGRPCPGYGNNYGCPPYSPGPNIIKKIIRRFTTYEIVVYEYGLETHIKTLKKKHPSWSEGKLYNPRLYNNHIYYRLRKYLNDRLKATSSSLFVLGNGNCKLCVHAGGCEAKYSRKCRYPNRLIKFSMESTGINVFETLHNAGYELERKPRTKVCQVALICS